VHGYWIGHYERRHQKIISRLIGPGDVFLDVGAHVGFYSLMASRRVGTAGRVIAFEPNPRNIDYLRRHISLNEAANVEIVEAAVSASDGLIGFEASGDSSMGHVLPDGQGTVRSISLNAWAEAADIAPTVIKIDVEGHEPPVLEGATEVMSKMRPTIVLSVGPESLRACEAILQEHDYRATPIWSQEGPTEFLCVPLTPRRRVA
jgi:FkbM family methyltransferase